MSDVDMEDALPDIIAQPIVNPDAQATVSDFLDYTEFFPSDLVRSLTLIGKLDHKYHNATQRIHELTRTYGTLPKLPADSRPDPRDLRQQISHALDEATTCRESAYSEARRLFDVAEKHAFRLGIIKKKLNALPKPPSRDPTPPPVSPQTARRRANSGAGPRLTLHLDGARHRQAGPGRPRGRKRTGRGSESPALSAVSWEDESGISEVEEPIKIKLSTGRKSRGVAGTNVHSAVAGISTSNAILQLSPPPQDSVPGSKHAPWLHLTEYEMAVLRKDMKKNAIWNPSDTMIGRELNKKGRGRENFEKAKARAITKGESYYDENCNLVKPPTIILGDRISEDSVPPRPTEAKKSKKESEKSEATTKLEKAEKQEKTEKSERGERATRRLRGGLDEANRHIAKTVNLIGSLFVQPAREQEGELLSPNAEKRMQGTRSAKKRKREGSPAEGQKAEPSDVVMTDAPTRSGPPKKLKIGLSAPLSLQSAPLKSPTPLLSPQIVVPGTAKSTTTITVPLAPAGPSTPSAIVSNRKSSSAAPSTSPPDPRKTPIPIPPVPSVNISVPTAATTRSRRSSAAPKSATGGTSPDLAPLTSRNSTTPAPSQPSIAVPTTALRLSTRRASSSRGASATVATPLAPSRSSSTTMTTTKAASAEPPPSRRDRHNLRRGSNVSLPSTSTSATAGARPTRSLRKKPTPGPTDDSTATSRRASVGPRKRKGGAGKRKGGGGTANENEAGDDDDGDNEVYCYCRTDKDDEVGMIACDNPNCEIEWFHMECLEMSRPPPKSVNWYCPECKGPNGLGGGGRRKGR